jgi:hypothetical protein
LKLACTVTFVHTVLCHGKMFVGIEPRAGTTSVIVSQTCSNHRCLDV